MPTNEPLQNFQIAAAGDPPDVPAWLAKAYNDLIRLGIPQYVSTAARDLALPTPADGQSCVTGVGTSARWWVGLGGQWVSFARASGTGLWSAEMPPSGSVTVNGQRSVTTTGYADVADATIGLTLPAPARVRLDAHMWMVTTVAAGGLRAGINVTGATVSGPESPTAGAAAILSGVAATLKQSAFKEIDFAAGLSTITLQAQRASGTAAVNYAYLGYQVIRWL